MKKKRIVDFSVEEMCDLSGLDRKQFTDTLKRFCVLYNFEITDFKVDETNAKSNYFFPPEIAPPLALMLKYLQFHPKYRKNAKEGNITATDYAEYNHKMLKDIDEKLPGYFRDAIYSLMGHLVNYEISEWAGPFVRELSHFMINLTTIKNESVGATLRDFTKKLSIMNYNLYEGSYVFKMAEKANIEYLNKEMGIDMPNELDKTLQSQNISLDKLISTLIRWELVGAHKMRDAGFPELKDILDEINALEKILGVEYKLKNDEGKVLFEDIPLPSEEEQRNAYYEFVLGKTIDIARLKINEKAYETMKCNKENWRPIDEIIDNKKTIKIDEIKKMYQTYINQEIVDISKRLSEVNQEKERFEQSGEVPKYFYEKIKYDREILLAYSEYCRSLDESEKRINDIVDHFVGEALFEFLNN